MTLNGDGQTISLVSYFHQIKKKESKIFTKMEMD